MYQSELNNKKLHLISGFRVLHSLANVRRMRPQTWQITFIYITLSFGKLNSPKGLLMTGTKSIAIFFVL